jgi:hypothetical protein
VYSRFRDRDHDLVVINTFTGRASRDPKAECTCGICVFVLNELSSALVQDRGDKADG